MANKIYGNHSFPTAKKASCSTGLKSCANGKCYPESMWCNGVADCLDASDETHCPCKTRIAKARMCDGFYDCPLGEDELGCFSKSIYVSFFFSWVGPSLLRNATLLHCSRPCAAWRAADSDASRRIGRLRFRDGTRRDIPDTCEIWLLTYNIDE